MVASLHATEAAAPARIAFARCCSCQPVPFMSHLPMPLPHFTHINEDCAWPIQMALVCPQHGPCAACTRPLWMAAVRLLCQWIKFAEFWELALYYYS